MVPGVNPLPPGRHAKPPSEAELALENALRSVGSRWLVAAGGLLAGMALVVVLAMATLSSSGTKGAPAHRVTASQAAQKTKSSATSVPTGVSGRGTTDSEPGALSYFQGKDAGVAGHVKDVRWSGQFLRVYTDYPETADNSRPALELCQWTWDYLASQNAPGPVFVQGTSVDNGAVVLAKKLDERNSCRVGK